MKQNEPSICESRARKLSTGICLAAAALLVSSLSAQDLRLDLRGYAKNLAIRSRSLITDEAYVFDVTRLRLQGGLNVGALLRSEIWLDTEFSAGDFLSTPDFQVASLLERPFFLDLNWTVTNGHNYALEQRLFRAFATLYLGSAEITAGRQRIAWGTGFAWNPTDLLNPFNPAAIELDEKEGVDAVHVSVPFGALSRIEAAYAPGRSQLEPSLALRGGSHVGNYDFSLMLGEFRNDKVIGGDFAGYIGGAGFRGEFAYTWASDDNYFRSVLNADYNFPGDFYGIVEFYYNGQGAWSKDDYDLTDLLSGATFNLARLYVAASVIKSVTPLLQVSFYGLWNLNDGSTLFGPAAAYSLATNLEVSASAYFFLGSDDSEFGQLPSVVFASLQYYF